MGSTSLPILSAIWRVLGSSWLAGSVKSAKIRSGSRLPLMSEVRVTRREVSNTPQQRDALPSSPRRLRSDPRTLEWAEFLKRFRLETYCTLTYSDAYASKFSIFTPRAALKDFSYFLRELNYRGSDDFFVACEWGNQGRDVPHLHALLGPVERNIYRLAWQQRRGWATVYPVTDGAHSYVAKYVLKDIDGDSYDFRLRKV